jgi:prepilin-type N-terminal cleavage/methylation domain-containing protein
VKQPGSERRQTSSCRCDRILTSDWFSRSMAPGFTLIEIMLAVAILAVIFVMLAGSFHAVVAGKMQAESHMLQDAAARATLSQIVNEIRGAVQTSSAPSRVLLMGEGHVRNGRAIDSVTVSTLNPGHRRSLEDFGAEDTVSYLTVPNPDHAGWYLLLRRQNSSLLGIGTGTNAEQPTVLAANLLALHIRYFDGAIWSESWNSQSLPPGRQLPTEIAADLVIASRSSPISLSTTVTLPMAFLQW